jgi:hypothetical protein
MFENIAAAQRWAIDKGAARNKVTPAKSRSQVYLSAGMELSKERDSHLKSRCVLEAPVLPEYGDFLQ